VRNACEIITIIRLWLFDVYLLNRKTFNLFLINFKNGLLLAGNILRNAVEEIILRQVA